MAARAQGWMIGDGASPPPKVISGLGLLMPVHFGIFLREKKE